MKTLTLALSLLLAAGLAVAGDTTNIGSPDMKTQAPAEAKAQTQAAKPTAHQAEVVSADAAKKTLTFKEGADSKTLPVDKSASAKLKGLTAGQKVTLMFRDNAQNEPEAVTSIKVTAAAKAPHKASASTKPAASTKSTASAKSTK